MQAARPRTALRTLFATAATAFIALAAVPYQAAAQNAPERPPVVFEPEILDLDHVDMDIEVTRTVKIRNESRKPLRILRVKPDCSCTTPELEEDLIMPGEAVDLTVVIDTGPEPGILKKKVDVSIRNYQLPATLKIEAMLTRKIFVDPFPIPRSDDMKGTLRVFSTDKSLFSIRRFNGQEASLINPPAKGEKSHQYFLQYDLGSDPAAIPLWCVIETDHPEAPVVEVVVEHPIVRDENMPDGIFRPRAMRLNVGVLKTDQPSEHTFTVVAASMRHNYTVSVGDPESGKEAPVDVELLSVERTEKNNELDFTVRITPRPGHEGLLYERFNVSVEGANTTSWTWLMGTITSGDEIASN